MRKILAFICAVCVFCAVLLCGCRTVEVVEVEVSEEVTTTATLPVKTTASTTTTATTAATTTTMTTMPTGATFPAPTLRPHPYITMYLDAEEYEPDATVKFHLVDSTNTGFSIRSSTLLKWSNGRWITAMERTGKCPIRVYGAIPDTEKGYIDKSWSLDLSKYADVQRGERYKLLFYQDGYEISSEFTIAEE